MAFVLTPPVRGFVSHLCPLLTLPLYFFVFEEKKLLVGIKKIYRDNSQGKKLHFTYSLLIHNNCWQGIPPHETVDQRQKAPFGDAG